MRSADPSDEEDAVANEIGDALLRTLSQQVWGRKKGHGPRFSEFIDTGRDTSLSSLRESTFRNLKQHSRPTASQHKEGAEERALPVPDRSRVEDTIMTGSR